MWKKMKNVVQINEQGCIQKSDGKLKKYNQCKIFKQQKGNNSRLLFTDTDSLMTLIVYGFMKLKLKMPLKILAIIKKCMTLVMIPLNFKILSKFNQISAC